MSAMEYFELYSKQITELQLQLRTQREIKAECVALLREIEATAETKEKLDQVLNLLG